jgi:serine protease AprX
LVVTAAGAQDFALSLSPSSRTMNRRTSTSFTVGITRTGGLADAVTLSVSGLPGGTSSSFNPNQTTGTSSTLSIFAGRRATPGTYHLTVTGRTGGGLVHTATATLQIN